MTCFGYGLMVKKFYQKKSANDEAKRKAFIEKEKAWKKQCRHCNGAFLLKRFLQRKLLNNYYLLFNLINNIY